ncbi:hypothetical protein EDB85DRAFT_1896560 [Lactarius pseudohatsudake]|nr:hypothetical protein EDB85DRAFT_1896560 [Lactarius pseudohatsudake]
MSGLWTLVLTLRSSRADGHLNLQDKLIKASPSSSVIMCSMVFKTRPSERLGLGAVVCRPKPCPQLRMMSTRHQSPSPEETKKRKVPIWVPEDGGISKEISWLQDNIAANPCLESTQPRQEPAMSRYHGAPFKPRPELKEKRRHSHRSQKKANGKGTNALTESQEVPTHPEALTKPEVPALPRRSEVAPSRMQPEVIDLTGED